MLNLHHLFKVYFRVLLDWNLSWCKRLSGLSIDGNEGYNHINFPFWNGLEAHLNLDWSTKAFKYSRDIDVSICNETDSCMIQSTTIFSNFSILLRPKGWIMHAKNHHEGSSTSGDSLADKQTDNFSNIEVHCVIKWPKNCCWYMSQSGYFITYLVSM